MGTYAETLLPRTRLYHRRYLTETIKRINMKKLFKTEKRRDQAIVLFLAILLAGIFWGIAGPFNMTHLDNVTISQETITLEGGDAIQIPTSDIAEVSLIDKMPPVSFRLNGSSFKGINTGYFMLGNGEKCFLFLRNGTPPFIHIRYKTGVPAFFNRKKPDETRQVYQEILSVCNPKSNI